MSANPDLRVCHIEKAEKSLVDFVAEMRVSFEQHRNDLSAIPHEQAADWARNILRSSQDVKSPDEAQQGFIEELREFVKEIRKVFTKHGNSMHEVKPDPIIEHASALLTRAGYVETRTPFVPPPPRRMSH